MAEIIKNSLSIQFGSNFKSSIQIEEQIDDFMNDDSKQVIFIFSNPSTKSLQISNDISGVPFSSAETSALGFIKNNKNILPIPLSQSSIKLTIEQIYKPIYPQFGSIWDSINKKIQSELEKKIPTPKAFVNLWYKKAGSDMSGKLKKFADIINDIVIVITGDQYQSISERDSIVGHAEIELFQDISRSIDITHDALSNLWNEGFGEDNMLELLMVVDNFLTQRIRNGLINSNIDIFIELSVSPAISATKMWLDTVHQLTTTFWAKEWSSGEFKSPCAVNLFNKLQTSVDLKNIERQTIQLLEKQDSRYFSEKEPFKFLNKTTVLEKTMSDFEEGCKHFDNCIQNFLVEVLAHIRMNLNFKTENVNVSHLRMIQRWSGILCRYGKKQGENKELISEILAGIKINLKNIKKRYDMGYLPDTSRVEDEENYNEIVDEISWANSMRNSVSLSKKVIEKLAGRDHRYIQLCYEHDERLKSYISDVLNEWKRETEYILKNNFNSNSAVVKLNSANRQFYVTFDSKLDVIVRTTRRLISMGFDLPNQIYEKVDQIQKIKNYANTLKQIAFFYNTADQQMISSQRPMLLNIAVSLERLVKTCEKISWNEVEKLNEIMPEIRTTTINFDTENQKLRQFERRFLQKLGELEKLNDLVSHELKWSQGLNDIRNLCKLVEDEYGSQNSLAWLQDCEKRVANVLNTSYKNSIPLLLTNNTNLNLKAEVILSHDGILEYKPSIETLESQLTSSIKKFSQIPENLKGFTSNSKNAFRFISTEHQSDLKKTVSKTGDTITQLKKLLDHYKGWFRKNTETGLIIMDGETLKNEIKSKNFKSSADFESNIRSIKNRGSEVERIGDFQMIDCLTVDLTNLRNCLHKHHSLWYDALLSVLKEQILSPVKETTEFLDSAFKEIAYEPKSAEETTIAAQQYNEIEKRAEEFKVKLNSSNDLFELLHHVDSFSATRINQNMNSLNEKMEQLLTALTNQKSALEHTINQLKNAISEETDIFQDSIKTFLARFKMASENALNNCGVSRKTRKQTRSWLTDLNQFSEDLKTVSEEFEKIVAKSKAFGLDPPNKENFVNLVNQVEETKELWGIFSEYDSILQKMEAKKWIIFRDELGDFEDFCISWDERLRKLKNKNSIQVAVQKEVERFREAFVGLKFMKGESLSESHWSELFRMIGLDSGMLVDKLDFEMVLNSTEEIIQKSGLIKELNKRAVGEASARKAFRELEVWAADTMFKLKKQDGIMVITEWADLICEIDEKSALVSSLQDSPYVNNTQNLSDQQKLWTGRLSSLDLAVQTLHKIQRKWLYLEPVIMGGALPSEKARFSIIDQQFRNSIMRNVTQDPRVLSILPFSNGFENLLEQLNQTQTALTNHLESKRQAEPRFYFIGDDDLLELLGQALKPEIFQQHLKKMFMGIYYGEFQDKNMVAMMSHIKERVPLENSVKLETNVENSVQSLGKSMHKTLKNLSEKYISNNVENLEACEQVLITGERVFFAEKCAKCINEGIDSLKAFKNQNLARLEKLTKHKDAAGFKIKSLIFDLIHWNEILDLLIRENVENKNDWNWTKQLRFQRNLTVNIMDSTVINYTFEYQGNTEKLVHTPLTDKCFLTLSLALHLGLGGNPYGPAGTGKTESVKALGNALGRLVLVFNCDEGIDVKSMSRIFIGLVECGAWGCFDEFNRLDEFVLSALSSDIQMIQEAVKQKHKNLSLPGRRDQIRVNTDCAIFVTLNPAGKGYGGRQKLPDNLKQLFRPVAMTKPDVKIISEVYLYALGFQQSKKLATKLVTLFELCSETLSWQHHYDWNLRALKAVLKTAGGILRKQGQSEQNAVIESLKINTISKLTESDRSIFGRLISDFFKEIDSSQNSKDRQILIEKTRDSCKKLGYQFTENLGTKVIELYEQLEQRMGVVILGPTCSGKTVLWNILANIVNASCQVINAKAMSRKKLLGNVNQDTREWTDGVLTSSSRQAVADYEAGRRSFIICDSEIDPEWIEALNSVLDDNRLLTLPSGERIQFPSPGVNFIFETNDVTPASPATISRMGIIFMTESDVTKDSVIKSVRLTKNSEFNHQELTILINDIFEKYQSSFLRPKISIINDVVSTVQHINSKQEMAYAIAQILSSNSIKNARQIFIDIVSRYGLSAPDSRNPQASFFYSIKS